MTSFERILFLIFFVLVFFNFMGTISRFKELDERIDDFEKRVVKWCIDGSKQSEVEQ